MLLTEATFVKFAEKLRELRDASGLSERQLADKAGIPYGTLHTYTQGRREPLLSNLAKLSKALGVTMDYFADCDEVTGTAAGPSKKKKKRK